MHDFTYKNNELYCEKVKVSDIVQKTGTPVYIYSHKTLVEHIDKIKRAFKSVNPLICYSMKANSSLAVLKAVISRGAGLDIVSGGELHRAKRVGCDPKKIVFAGVGKTAEEIEEAVRCGTSTGSLQSRATARGGILLFNVESVPELEAINEISKRLKKKVNASLRVNPGVDPRTHHHIATGKAESKFGMDLETATALFRERHKYPSVDLCAVHVHIGSQITVGEPFVEAFQKILKFVDEIEKLGVKIKYLNLGGGLGVIYDEESPQTAEEFARKILPLFKGRSFRLILEPGRFVAANAGILAAQVIYIKQTNVKNFAIVDAAMNDLIRPSLYDAYHQVWPLVKKEKSPKWVYDVVGPVCESGDVLAKDRHLQELKPGDQVAIMTAGAYGYVMSSNYNSRPRAAEVMVKGNQFAVIKRRETLHDLLAGETLPAFI